MRYFIIFLRSHCLFINRKSVSMSTPILNKDYKNLPPIYLKYWQQINCYEFSSRLHKGLMYKTCLHIFWKDTKKLNKFWMQCLLCSFVTLRIKFWVIWSKIFPWSQYFVFKIWLYLYEASIKRMKKFDYVWNIVVVRTLLVTCRVT